MIKKFMHIGWTIGFSHTARSLYWVFSGNAIVIVLTFFTTILVANSLSKAENGIFLSLLTLASLLSDLGEAGLGSSLSSFIPGLLVQATPQSTSEARSFLATAFKLELGIAFILGGIVALFSLPLAQKLFASTAPSHVLITALMTSILILYGFSTFALSAYKKFQEVALVNIFYSLVRLALIILAAFVFHLSLSLALIIYLVAFAFGWIYSLIFLRSDFLFTKSSNTHAAKLIKFSSFLAVQKIFVAISGRLDLLMLIPLASAVEAGVYGIASRFSLVYPLLVSSLGQVFAPKFAEFTKSRDALIFFKKTGIVVCLLIFSQVIFFIFAKPLLDILVPKYQDAVPVLRALIVALTGFIIATPFTSFLVYTLKKPQITTIASGVQLVIIFSANLLLIPRYGRFAPAIGIGIGNAAVSIIAIFATWYYLRKEIYEYRA